MNRSAAHTALVNAIAIELSKLPDVLVSKNPSGEARYGNARVTYGAFGPGAPDLLVVVAPAILIAIEAKTGDAVQEPDQRQCERRLARYGVRYIVARSVEDALTAVATVRRRLAS